MRARRLAGATWRTATTPARACPGRGRRRDRDLPPGRAHSGAGWECRRRSRLRPGRACSKFSELDATTLLDDVPHVLEVVARGVAGLLVPGVQIDRPALVGPLPG